MNGLADLSESSRLAHSNLPVRVDGGDGHEDTGSSGEGSAEVGCDREQTEDGSSERGGGGDHLLELLVHGSLPVAGHDHLLLLELLGNLPRTRARDLDPRLGEQRALEEQKGERGGFISGSYTGDRGRAAGRRTAETVKMM